MGRGAGVQKMCESNANQTQTRTPTVCSTAISGQPAGAQLLIIITCEKQKHNSRANYANNEIGSVYVARALIDEF